MSKDSNCHNSNCHLEISVSEVDAEDGLDQGADQQVTHGHIGQQHVEGGGGEVGQVPEDYNNNNYNNSNNNINNLSVMPSMMLTTAPNTVNSSCDSTRAAARNSDIDLLLLCF